MSDDIEAHMVNCNPKDRPSNLINHISEHDGTRRSEQACYLIEKFNPETAKDMAFIMYGNEQPTVAGNKMIDYYPMFWEDKKLVDFCRTYAEEKYPKEKDDKPFSGSNRSMREWVIKTCVGGVDKIDIYADVWRLSPNIKQEYPTKEKWKDRFKDSRIVTGDGDKPFEGWHDFKNKSEEYELKIAKKMEKI